MMIDFKGVTHVIENPNGHASGYNYSLVGHVPISMLEGHKPTTADIMAGRVQRDGLAYSGRKWETIPQIVAAAKMNNVTLCTSPTCACRKLFSAALLLEETQEHVFQADAKAPLYCAVCGASETDHRL
jgi:hypothetical protein